MTAFREFVQAAADWVENLSRTTENVCIDCLKTTDEEFGPAGDFSLCKRCGEDITSKSGVQIRGPKREPEPMKK